MSFPFGEKDLA